MAGQRGDGSEQEPRGTTQGEAPDTGPDEVEETAQQLPSFTPQARTGDGDAENEASERLPGFTPQGRTDS